MDLLPKKVLNFVSLAVILHSYQCHVYYNLSYFTTLLLQCFLKYLPFCDVFLHLWPILKF